MDGIAQFWIAQSSEQGHHSGVSVKSLNTTAVTILSVHALPLPYGTQSPWLRAMGMKAGSPVGDPVLGET